MKENPLFKYNFKLAVKRVQNLNFDKVEVLFQLHSNIYLNRPLLASFSSNRMLFILIRDCRTRATFYSDKRYDSPNINKESKDTKSIDHGVQADQ